MSRHHGSSDREPTLQLGIASDWTPEQAFAEVEMLEELREVIYAHYLQQIQDHLRADRQTITRTPCEDDPSFRRGTAHQNTRGLPGPLVVLRPNHQIAAI